jgi:hypothetical protein
MRIPPDQAIIAWSKIVEYLLVFRVADDKSKLLGTIGFTADDPHALEAAIHQHIADHDAVIDRTNEHGVYYRVEGAMIGPNGKDRMLVTIWIVRANADGKYYFVTLRPV